MVLLDHFVNIIGSKVSGGFYGVNLFFVLSGFLITSILLAEKDQRFRSAYTKFLGRRVLRIFPIYYMVIAFLILVNAKGIQQNLSTLLTYTYNYQVGQTNQWETLYSPYWSLSVEEQFYILFPIIVLLIKQYRGLLLGIFLTIVLVGYGQVFLNIFGIQKYNYVGLPTNMSYLSLGAIGALAINKEKLPNSFFTNKYVELLTWAILIFALTSHNWNLKRVVCPLANLYLVIKASAFKFNSKFVDKFLTNSRIIYVGRISYGIYLYHLIVAYFFTKYLFDPVWLKIPFNSFGRFYKLQYNSWVIKFPIVTLLTIIVAGLSFKFIETPILKLKDKYFKY
ncbi:acyltransferase [Hanamia caeni]|jgi:peptidoglycan/LPS O-acetylase OafA/YrhL|uniref:Acyltransferase n=2 Tax=Hanamia caeni TaxID=2294116 RepID=A0A3M9N2Z1_9BACT|nr:acyltransferase [Hanamia caeni]